MGVSLPCLPSASPTNSLGDQAPSAEVLPLPRGSPSPSPPFLQSSPVPSSLGRGTLGHEALVGSGLVGKARASWVISSWYISPAHCRTQEMQAPVIPASREQQRAGSREVARNQRKVRQGIAGRAGQPAGDSMGSGCRGNPESRGRWGPLQVHSCRACLLGLRPGRSEDSQEPLQVAQQRRYRV